MKYEQQKLMKVIPFSRDIIKMKLTNEKLDKLEVAYKVLKYLIEQTDAEFNIVVDIEKAKNLFEVSEKQLAAYKYFTLTTNYEREKESISKSVFYEIKGDEFK